MFLSGCFYFWNVLPNKSRDEYYATHGPSFHDSFFKIDHGMAKDEVLKVLGKPEKIRKNGDWFYSFPNEGITKFYVRFKDDKVIKLWN